MVGRGPCPADILLIGEAPGRIEDLMGVPFIGPSGRLLDAMVVTSAKQAGLPSKPTILVTNVVACRPVGPSPTDNRAPTGEEALACWPRLDALYRRCRPKVILFVGRVAERMCKAQWPGGHHIFHPAFILRRGGAESVEYSIFIRRLAEIFAKFF